MAALNRRRESQDDEDYWMKSTVNKNKSKFNIFDDDVTVETAEDLAKSKKLLSQFDEEDVDTVNWDDTPVSKSITSSAISDTASSLPKSSYSTVPSTRNVPPYMTHSRSQSESFGVTARVSFTPPSQEPSFPVVQYSKSQEKLQTLSSSTSAVSIEDAISGYKSTNSSSRNQEEEIQYLKRALRKAKELKFSPEETIKKMVLGEPYSLEIFRYKEEKLQLLDKAIQVHDGNAITAVVLFLKQTIKPSLFNLELQRRPVAVNHYLSYLRAHYDFKELGDVLGMLNRTEEAAILKYKQAVGTSDVRGKMAALKGCLKAHFLPDPDLTHEANLVEQHASLLERQWPIEDADSKAEAQGSPVFKQHPRKVSILNMPLITTLYYCCFYHGRDAENLLTSPVAIKKQHQLSDKQYIWTALSARSRLRHWTGIEELLTAKGWFGSTKNVSVIGFDKVCEILHKTSAPEEILSKYLRMIDGSEKRFNLARKYKCHEVVVETLVSLRDRAELQAYASKLPPGSQGVKMAQDALRSSTIKWKT
ncbi:spermatogenesis-defective protein 39 homolog isoform X1 [Saccostrea echinata]|uniref:spermatogenesis-defective protein 39 homolog isoform X1 n=1 Tax=Saccostrea echinata TaxID=191078 RepID=UPI002A81EE30|nr:spermatogenesis-defective protein 39 homolog isoform X1 [Saccostrea echinata]